jgi:lipoprotein-releasing system permease protein
MNFEWFIALKHLVKGRRHGFVSLISLISILGVAVGVMALIVVLAVMSGFDRELKSKIVGVQPHLRIEGIGGIRDSTGAARRVKTLGFTDLNSISPYVEGQSIIRSDQNAVGIVVKGVDPHTEPLALFEQKMKVGTLEFTDVNASLNDNKERWIGRAVIGETLARRLKIDVGYVVTLISPALEEESLKRAVKKAKSVAFVVSGIFRVGMNDFDSGLVLVSLGRAQELFQLGERVTGMGLRLGDPNNADALKTPLRREFGASYQVRSWTDLNRTFFAALQVERTVMTILLSLIILVAAFNIVSTLIMIVMEKTRDIGVMRAIGATKSAVRSIF